MKVNMADSEKTLEEFSKDYITQKAQLREEEKDYKSIREMDERAADLKKHWNGVKRLREEIKEDQSVKSSRDRIWRLKFDLKLVEEIIVSKMRDQQLSLFELPNQGEFQLNDKLKFKKFRKKKFIF